MSKEHRQPGGALTPGAHVHAAKASSLAALLVVAVAACGEPPDALSGATLTAPTVRSAAAGAPVPLTPLQQARIAALADTATAFSQDIATTHDIIPGAWNWFDVERCYLSPDTPTCWGTNPNSPYGTPVFAIDQVLSADYLRYLVVDRGQSLPLPPFSSQWQMEKSSAVVVLFVTPPSLRYFSLEGLLKDHPGWMLQTGGQLDVFGSVADSLNVLNTTAFNPDDTLDTTPRTNLAAAVFTADENAFDNVRDALTTSTALPASAIHLIPIPATVATVEGAFPLADAMSLQGLGDAYTMLMRVALPDVEEEDAFWAFIDNNNASSLFKVFHLTPRNAPAFVPAQPIAAYTDDTGSIDETTMVVGSKSLEEHLDFFHQRVLTAIKNRTGVATDPLHVAVSGDKEHGLECITKLATLDLKGLLPAFFASRPDYTCGGDNYDAIYTGSVRSDGLLAQDPGGAFYVDPDYQTKTDFGGGDYLVVSGVNHAHKGTATYVNHVIQDPRKDVGVLAVNDTAFNDGDVNSMAHLLGVGPGHPLYPYVSFFSENFYTVVFAYDCAGLDRFCFEIPDENDAASDPDVTYFVNRADGFELIGRFYLNPETMVKPSNEQVVLHRVSILDR